MSWDAIQKTLGLTSLVMSPRDSSVLYSAGIRASAYVSRDAGANWEALEGLPDGWISALAINPLAPSTLYAGTYGFYTSGVFTLGSDVRDVSPVSPPNRSRRVVSRPD